MAPQCIHPARDEPHPISRPVPSLGSERLPFQPLSRGTRRGVLTGNHPGRGGGVEQTVKAAGDDQGGTLRDSLVGA